MLIVNTDHICGKELEMLGLVKGSTVQSKHISIDIGDMMAEARNIATYRMMEEAKTLGADAIVNVRYATSAITQGAAEVMAYGTAVKFK